MLIYSVNKIYYTYQLMECTVIDTENTVEGLAITTMWAVQFRQNVHSQFTLFMNQKHFMFISDNVSCLLQQKN